PSQILLMQALHDDRARGSLWVVDAISESQIPPIIDRVPMRLGLHFLRVVWIVHEKRVSAIARNLCAASNRKTPAPTGVFEIALGVLIVGHRPADIKGFPIPLTFEQITATDRVAH